MRYFRSSLSSFATTVLFCASLAAAPVAAQDAPSSRIVEGAGGVPLVVHEWGNPEGIPVLMLHGFSFGAVAFKNQIGPIANQIRFIAPDLRGHGLSAKPWQPEAYAGTEVWAEDVARIVEAYALKRPVIVGWSFGGYVAMNYLRHCGTDCASGLLLAGSLAGIVPRPPPPDPAAAAETERPPMQGDARVDNYHELFLNAEWLARVMTFKPPSEEALRQKELTVVMMPPYVRRAMVGLALDNTDMPSQLNLPILFIHGEKDSSVPVTSVVAAIAALPKASALAIPDVGHSPFAEAPETFNAALLDFAQSVRGK
jgi:non-heme chloroperoxidase